MTSFIELFIGSFNDPVLMVLIAAAVVSFVLGIWGPGDDHENGWIEGVAIMAAVLIVAVVTASNDYAKELQFRALAKFAQTMESCTVIRDGASSPRPPPPSCHREGKEKRLLRLSPPPPPPPHPLPS